jgi:4-diphosphocytidyl-2-C-methyl-D-erythritol kinase
MKNLTTRVNRSLTVLAPAKLNLTFNILSKRPDGYHELITLFQAIELCDKLTFHFSPADTNQIRLKTESNPLHNNFPLDDTNLINKAASLYWGAARDLRPTAVQVSVEKNIPIGAGLAGGSANAAAALVAFNNYYGNPYTNVQLLAMAAQLGSDIPFCLFGGSSVGRGRGELLSAITSPCPLHFVIVKPKTLSISTAWAYSAFDEHHLQPSDKEYSEQLHQKIVTDLVNGNLSEFATGLGNAFEPLVFARYPILLKLTTRLRELGCLTAHLTGSGPTMYGLVPDASTAARIAKQIITDGATTSGSLKKNDGEFPLDVWTTKSVNHGVKLLSDEKE